MTFTSKKDSAGCGTWREEGGGLLSEKILGGPDFVIKACYWTLSPMRTRTVSVLLTSDSLAHTRAGAQ